MMSRATFLSAKLPCAPVVTRLTASPDRAETVPPESAAVVRVS